jgi:pimeloyl-ACP methyl ester carboxylesterase
MQSEHTEHTITLNNHRITYTAVGHPDAPPLLMIHGWMSHRGVWHQTINALQDRFYCVALDLLGFGNSDKPAKADYSIPAQGQYVLQLANALGFARFTLMGHSMGGQIALCLASMLAPERVTKLISVAGIVSARLSPAVENANSRSVALGAVIPQVYSLSRWMLRYDWFVRFSFGTWFHNMDAVPFAEWEVDRRMACQSGIHIPAYQAGQAIHNLNLVSHLYKITAPTLAIAGKQDAVVPISDSQLIKENVSNSQLVWIEECGHFPMYEKTAQYLEAVQPFLN